MYIKGKGRAAGRVGSDFLSRIARRVGSTFRWVGSGPRKVTRGQICSEDAVWRDMTWHDKAWRGVTGRVVTGRDMTGHDVAWHGSDVTSRDMM